MSKVSERDLREMNFLESFGFPIELTNKWIERRNQKIKERVRGFRSKEEYRIEMYQYTNKLWKDRFNYGTKDEMKENGIELTNLYIQLIEERNMLVDYLLLIKELVEENKELQKL